MQEVGVKGTDVRRCKSENGNGLTVSANEFDFHGCVIRVDVNHDLTQRHLAPANGPRISCGDSSTAHNPTFH